MESFRFRAFGFPVVVEPTFLLVVGVALLFELSGGGSVAHAFLWGAVVFGSVLVHELGHALAARGLGVPVGTITLHGLGGHVATGRTTAGRSLVVSVAGPGAGLLLGAATLLALPALGRLPMGDRVGGDLLYVNVVWSLFNLLPLYPLDGGHALRAGLALVTRDAQAVRITAGIGVIVGALVMVFGWQTGAMFVMWLGGFAAWTNWQMLPRG